MESGSSRAMTPLGRRLLRGLALLVCAGAVAWLLGWGEGGSPSQVARVGSPADEQRWSELQRAISEEAAARRELAREVAALREALDNLGALEPGSAAPLHSEDALETAAAEAATTPPSFDVEALLQAGFDPVRAADLRELWEEHELEKLYLRDQAQREGWATNPRYRAEQSSLADRLRREVGDEAYGAMLYARGQPNAVEVTDVLGGSPADDAGIHPGDAILRYDGTRVFLPSELSAATFAGEAGEIVSLEVLREGRPLTLRVRRGPLGVLLRAVRNRPPT